MERREGEEGGWRGRVGRGGGEGGWRGGWRGGGVKVWLHLIKLPLHNLPYKLLPQVVVTLMSSVVLSSENKQINTSKPMFSIVNV